MYTQDFNVRTLEPSTEYLGGGRGGIVINALAGVRYDPGMLKPFMEDDRRSPYYGKKCVNVLTGRKLYNRRPNGTVYNKALAENAMFDERRTLPVEMLRQRGIDSPVFNATALRKEEWIQLDTAILRAARYRLRAYGDLAKANTFGGFNGMNKMILEHETMSDIGQAVVDMDGLTPGRTDRPQFQLQGLPLPITHCDFTYNSREMGISRGSGTPLDTSSGENGGRRVAEMIEKTTIGITTGVIYGGQSTQQGGYTRASQVYGYVNFPARLTVTTWYRPTGNGSSGTGWTPNDTFNNVLAAIDQLRANKFYGPWIIYTSNDWDQYLERPFYITSTASNVPISTKSLRQMIKDIGDGDSVGQDANPIMAVRRLDFLFASVPSASSGPGGANINGTYPFTMIFVQMTPDVARAVNGMDITTIQWDAKGGMELNIKILAIQVPQLRADFYGNCGILQATATV